MKKIIYSLLLILFFFSDNILHYIKIKYTSYTVMTQNYSVKSYICEYCNYTTNRNYNLIRHQNAKHYISICEIMNKKLCEEKVSPNEEKVSPNKKILNHKFICKKCNKLYKTKKYLTQHELTCSGLDELTCSRCMISFTTKQAKYKHIKKGNCKPRSIMYARTSNFQDNNITNNNNIQTQNNYNNITNITNNLIINNYGNERIDYLNYEKMLEIFKKAYDIPSLLTKEIHFNNRFPENNNILYKNDNTSLIKYDDEFILKGLNDLVQDLITEKTKLMQKFAIENKDNICLKMDNHIYEDIIELLIKLILLKEPSEHYKKQVNIIRNMIKNSNHMTFNK